MAIFLGVESFITIRIYIMEFKHRISAEHTVDYSKCFIFRGLELNFAICFHHPCSHSIFSFFVELFVVEVMMATKDGPAGKREDSGMEVQVIGGPIVSIAFS